MSSPTYSINNLTNNHIINSGHLKVSDLHSIYYERCGHIGTNPILFVHGGPGAGFSEKDKRFFDFAIHDVVFFDQRGASRSKPFGELKDNTTQNLASDIVKLLDHLGIKSIIIFGGSWGTTLSLFFAINYPSRVKSILLRAVFLANNKAISHFIQGGTKDKCPQQWKRFIQLVPENSRNQVAQYYLSKMRFGSQKEQELYCYEWAYYEISIFDNHLSDKEVDKIIKSYSFKSLSILESHYMANNCFLPEDYIMLQLDKLRDIPCIMIHGEDDNICLVEDAKRLSVEWTNAKLYIEKAGHADRHPAIESRIAFALNELVK